MLTTHIQNGTSAGWKILRSAFRTSWLCSQGHGPNAHYWRNCPVCGEPRPDLREV